MSCYPDDPQGPHQRLMRRSEKESGRDVNPDSHPSSPIPPCFTRGWARAPPISLRGRHDGMPSGALILLANRPFRNVVEYTCTGCGHEDAMYTLHWEARDGPLATGA
jgi:hypothetical protein